MGEQCVRNQERGVPFERLETCSLRPTKPGEGCFSASEQNSCFWNNSLLLSLAVPRLAFALSETRRALAGLLAESAVAGLPFLPSQSS